MTIEEQLQRLTNIVDSLAGSVVAHDNQIEAHDRQIEALIAVAEKQSAETTKMRDSILALERQWQAYLRTLPRQ